MKPAPFEYVAPHSLDAALNIMQEYGYDAKLLAGGQSLVPMMNFRLAQPAVLVDLSGISELRSIGQNEAGELLVGAMARQCYLERDPLVAKLAPLVHEAIPYIAHPQIRNRGTMGGSLAHADPAAELPAVTLALKARFHLQNTAGERWVDAQEFFLGLFATSCGAEEILLEVAIPPLPGRTGYAFEEFARRHGDYALAGVAALLSLDDNGVIDEARLVYLSAGEVPITAFEAAALLRGNRPSDSIFQAAAELASTQEISPVGDIHATTRFKRHLARVLTTRALERAVVRAEA
jgi:carbon-monoxide dehydrogenase medium subunit